MLVVEAQTVGDDRVGLGLSLLDTVAVDLLQPVGVGVDDDGVVLVLGEELGQIGANGVGAGNDDFHVANPFTLNIICRVPAGPA